jgi:glyoxylase-like metal-dependent hydrolase (beta-lactamase superfamily II)
MISARIALLALAATAAGAAHAQPDANADIAIWPVQGNVYMLVGPAVNTTVQVGEDGVLVVDTQPGALGDELLAAIRRVSDEPIRYVVNTSADAAHVGANEAVARAGSTIAGGNVAGTIGDASEGAAVIAQENVLARMSAAEPAVPFDAWPTDTYIGGRKDLHFNGEAVEIIHRPAAHSDGDSIVFFRKSDVVSAGNVFITTSYPVIADGGHIQGIIDTLNYLIELTVPADKQEGGTYVIPGRGRLADEADVVEYRDMLTIIRDRVQSLVDEGKSLREVQAARPTRDYDGRYGAEAGPWTTEQFVEAVYRNLKERS